MDKILFTATVDSHILSFHIPYLKWFKEQGYEVHVASNGNADIPFVDIKHNVLFERSPFKFANIKAFMQLKKVISNNDYVIIHCHTPMGGVLTRLAAKKSRKTGTRVIYTAHGFHFYKGAPIINWLIYYPIEKWLSRYTDCLITINEEDHNTAIDKKFKASKINMVHGVGVDLNKFERQTKKKKSHMRKEYGYKEEDFILFYAAELNHNKHQDLLINVINILIDKIPNIRLLLAGSGPLENKYKKRVEQLDIKDNVDFLGYRNDIPNLLMLSDIVVASSKREGLPVNIMEAMGTGLPLVVTNIRGHRDLVNDGENGFVVDIDDVKGFANSIEELYKDEQLRHKFGNRSYELVQKYSLENVINEMKLIYT